MFDCHCTHRLSLFPFAPDRPRCLVACILARSLTGAALVDETCLKWSAEASDIARTRDDEHDDMHACICPPNTGIAWCAGRLPA